MDDDKGKKKKAESPLQGPDKKKARGSGDDASVSDAALASRDFAVALARARRNQAGLAVGGGSVPGIQNQMPVMPPPATAPVRPQPRPPSFQSGGDELARIPSGRYVQRPAAAASGSSASASRNQAGLAAAGGSVPGFQNQVRAPQATAPVWLQRRPPRFQSGGDELARIHSGRYGQRPAAATSGSSASAWRNHVGRAAAAGSVPGFQKPVMPQGPDKKKAQGYGDDASVSEAALASRDFAVARARQDLAAAAGGSVPGFQMPSVPPRQPRPPQSGGDELARIPSARHDQRPAAAASGSSEPASPKYLVVGFPRRPGMAMGGLLPAPIPPDMLIGGLLPAPRPPPAATPLLGKLDAPLPAAPAAQALVPACHAAGASTELHLGPPGTEPHQPEECPACRVRKGAMAAHPKPHRCLCQNCLAANATCPVCAFGSGAGGA